MRFMLRYNSSEFEVARRREVWEWKHVSKCNATEECKPRTKAAHKHEMMNVVILLGM